MSAHLELLSDEERARASAIELWLDGYGSPSGRRSMESSLRAIARAALGTSRDAAVRLESFPWELLADHTFFNEIEAHVVSRFGRQHAGKYVIAMRALLRSLAKSGVADYGAAARTLSMNKIHQSTTDPIPLSFTTTDLWSILRRCRQDSSPTKGRRDLAVISVGASTGARRSELVHVEFGDLDCRTRTVGLWVKGGGRRTASLHVGTMEHLEYWLDLRGEGAGPLFPSLRKGGYIGEQPMSDHQYWKMLHQRSEEAGVDPVISPHDLRRWYVSSLLDGGVDVFQVMRSVGHRRVDTTFRYDRRPQNRLREVVDSLDLPGLVDLEPDGD